MIDDFFSALLDIPGSVGGGGRRKGPSVAHAIGRALSPGLALVALGLGLTSGIVIGFADGGQALVTRPGLLALPALLPLAVAIGAGAPLWRGLAAGTLSLCVCVVTAIGLGMLRLIGIMGGL